MKMRVEPILGTEEKESLLVTGKLMESFWEIRRIGLIQGTEKDTAQ